MSKVQVIDTETSGFADNAEVIEFASVHLEVSTDECGLLTTHFHGYSAGLYGLEEAKLEPAASGVHHLTYDDIEGMPSFARCKPQLTGADYFVAHSAAYDRKFCTGGVFDVPWICTYKVAYELLPDMPDYKNQTLRYALGLKLPAWVPEQLAPHRALYDAAVTSELFAYLRGLGVDLDEMVAISSRPLLLRKVTFGQHYGKTWREVPAGYLRWILCQDFDADVVHTARHYLGLPT